MSGFFTGPRIAWGIGALQQLSGLSARSAFVVVDAAVAPKEGARRVVEELAKSETSVKVMTLGEAPDRVDRVEEIARELERSAADWLIALGGGRTLDAAKAARLAFERTDVPLPEVTPMLDLSDPPRVRLAAIPTTSGSGSEATATADLVTVEGAPFEIVHRGLAPDWALVDPSLAATLSPDLIQDGAFETCAQAFEAYVSAWANPFSDALALDAIATVLDRLPHALRWSDDPEAKAALHYAATSAGLAGSNAQRGIGHALARALVGPSGLSYGRLLGMLLPLVLEFDRPAARERIERLTLAVTRSEGGAPGPFASRVDRLLELFRFPRHLPAAGVDLARVEPHRSEIAQQALASPATLANPRVPSLPDVMVLLDRLLERSAGGPGAGGR